MQIESWRLGVLGALVGVVACGGEPNDGGVDSGGASGAAGGGGVAGFEAGAGDSAASGGEASATWVPPEGPVVCDGPGARFVTGVVAHSFGPGQSVGQGAFPEPILGPPVGAGCCHGSLDVVSLGNGGSVTVEFEGNGIVDGPGPDFTVFENPFFIGGDESAPFAELATVEVSADGVTWHTFPCDAKEAPYGSCAGWRPVFSSPDNAIDPLDPSVSGGDPFDLADLGLTEARYVRITDRADLAGMTGVFDLDAVGILHAACP